MQLSINTYLHKAITSLEKITTGVSRVGSVVNGTDCSYGGRRFKSQHQHRSLQLSAFQFQGMNLTFMDST